MDIKIVGIVDDADLETLWAMYSAALDDVKAMAVQRQVMYRNEFVDVMRDKRVSKYLCVDHDGTVRGLAASTNDLAASPMIAPPYFELHWPRQYAARKIWYIIFIAVHPQAPAGTFEQLATPMYNTAIVEGGIVGLDTCTYSDEIRGLTRDSRMLIDSLTADVQPKRIDEQSFWLYQFPPAGMRAVLSGGPVRS